MECINIDNYLEKLILRCKEAFAIQFFTGSFCETIKWWINSDMKMPPEEVVENYQKMTKFR